ncbi:hypothetical protein VIM7927_03094 [Vibrio mangrovi]|uniref:Uncharacterized protein n=1 Tax=Vibrio mangrovi TaxID=474394 RepID=A0A1Y6IVV8_9VIBR|nr:hypothetical protein VIM7927_03094 [Vibrio mangrovi]
MAVLRSTCKRQADIDKQTLCAREGAVEPIDGFMRACVQY